MSRRSLHCLVGEMREPLAYLSGVDYVLGALLPLSELELEDNERDELHLQGLRTISRFDQPLPEILARELGRYIETEGRPDLVLVASNSISGTDIEQISQRLGTDSGLPDLPLQFLTAGDCTNLAMAIRFGLSFLASQFAAKVIVVAADCAEDAVGGDPRAVYGGGLVGDAIAMCSLSKEEAGFAVLDKPVIIKDATLTHADDGRVAQSLKGMRDAVRGVLPDRNDVKSITQLVPNTYTLQSVDFLSLASRVSSDRIFTGNVARTGHCFAADTLINLADWADHQSVPSAKVLMLASGVFQWSAVLLETLCTSAQRSET